MYTRKYGCNILQNKKWGKNVIVSKKFILFRKFKMSEL